MKFHRFLRRECVRFHLETDCLPEPDAETPEHKVVELRRDSVLREIAAVMDESGEVSNVAKLTKDFIHGERKATTGIGGGIAIPHVRTLRARNFAMGFLRSDKGIPFGAIDGEPVHLFLPMIAPPYDDKRYWRVYQDLGEILQDESCLEILRNAETADEVIWGLQTFASF